MNREQFKNKFLVDVKIAIENREQCYKFQEIAFEFGVKVHSTMNKPMNEQVPIAYNIADVIPDYKGERFAEDMDNLVIYDKGTKLQKSAFFSLENDKKLILYADMLEHYENMTA